MTAVEIQRRDTVDRITYKELHANAIERAAWLSSQGIKPGDRVAILADNDAHWCAAYLGILSLGAIAVPLDTNYSATQVATIVGDSGSTVLLANDRLTPIARDALGHSSVACQLAPLKALENARVLPAHPARGSTAADPAVILYTSGTTSIPRASGDARQPARRTRRRFRRDRRQRTRRGAWRAASVFTRWHNWPTCCCHSPSGLALFTWRR